MTRRSSDLTPGSAFTDPSAADRDVIEQLRANGADLSQPRHVIVYLYFTTKSDADGAAADLASAGLSGSLASNEAQDSWLVKVEFHAVVSEEAVGELSGRMNAIAQRHHGVYDGWEASANP
jgi:hypothetical protein